MKYLCVGWAMLFWLTASAGELPSCEELRVQGAPTLGIACILASDAAMIRELNALHDCRVDEILDREEMRVLGKHYVSEKPCKRL
jgi:4-hydroxybenzoate polyprenyltransferase